MNTVSLYHLQNDVYISACFVTWCRSFMYIKSSGPKTEPCGTPWSLLSFWWCCWVRKVLNHLSGTPHIPCYNFDRRISWSTVSNASWRSRNTQHVVFPLSIAFLIFSVIAMHAWFVEWRLRKPNWLVYKKLLNSRNLESCLWKSFLIILLIFDKSEIGL